MARIPGDVLEGGKADSIPESAFDPKSVERGARVEREHTVDKTIAKEIARDHLAEDPKYYEKLEKMEKKAYEYGALFAVKTAARVGAAVPTGYRFDLNPQWSQSLAPEVQPQAAEMAAKITEWLRTNQALGSGYAQHPEFARQVALLGRMGKKALTPPGT